MHARSARRFTLIEVLVAMAILSLLGTALVLILRGGLHTWRRSEARRDSYDQAQAIFRQLREDATAISPPYDSPLAGLGAVENRLLCDIRHPENQDPATPAKGVGQRLILVRALKAESEHPITGHAGMVVGADRVIDLRDDLQEARAARLRATGGQMEVAWVLSEGGVLYRGIRAPIGPPGSLFEATGYELATPPRALDTANPAPPPGEKKPPAPPQGQLAAPPALLRPFASGVIHLEYRFWSQYTRGTWKASHPCRYELHEGERSGPLLVWDSTRALELQDGRQRSPREFTTFLGPRSLPDARDDVVPTKIRVQLVLQQEPIAGSSTYLLAPIDERSTEIEVEHPERLAWTEADGGYVYIGGEWIQFDSVEGNTISLSRGGRGARWTRISKHDTGQLVHVGKSFVTILDVPANREDWGDAARRRGR